MHPYYDIHFDKIRRAIKNMNRILDIYKWLFINDWILNKITLILYENIGLELIRVAATSHYWVIKIRQSWTPYFAGAQTSERERERELKHEQMDFLVCPNQIQLIHLQSLIRAENLALKLKLDFLPKIRIETSWCEFTLVFFQNAWGAWGCGGARVVLILMATFSLALLRRGPP